MSDTVILDEIRSVIAKTAELGFHGEGYSKIWAKLRFAGITADKERVRRIMLREAIVKVLVT